jgi:uridine kinase
VGVDGVDAAGKTTFADELVGPLENLDRHVIRASLDGFHHPRAARYRRGEDSPEGYFFDSFNYEALRAELLEPLGPGGDGRYRAAVFDHRIDSGIHAPTGQARPNSILVFDGVFLLRSELMGCWECTLFLDVGFDLAVERAAFRDQGLFGSAAEAADRYWKRYVPGQRLYLQTCRPKAVADILIDNNDPMNPRLIRFP